MCLLEYKALDEGHLKIYRSAAPHIQQKAFIDLLNYFRNGQAYFASRAISGL